VQRRRFRLFYCALEKVTEDAGKREISNYRLRTADGGNYILYATADKIVQSDYPDTCGVMEPIFRTEGEIEICQMED
jgi:hypothetical protein